MVKYDIKIKTRCSLLLLLFNLKKMWGPSKNNETRKNGINSGKGEAKQSFV